MQTIGKCVLAMTLATLAACSGDRGAAADAPANPPGDSTVAASPPPASPQNTDAAAGAGTADADKTNPPAASKESSVNELQAHIPSGSKLLDSKIGDLNGDGRPDALLVLDHGNDGKQGAARPRTIVLLVRDAGGQLQVSAQNDKVVPCSTCGGLLGDPYGYARIDKDGFTVVIEGGSRQRWSSEYKFQYSAQNWYLQKAERSAYDQISEQRVEKAFTPADFGQVAFSDFDPSTLPEVVLP